MASGMDVIFRMTPVAIRLPTFNFLISPVLLVRDQNKKLSFGTFHKNGYFYNDTGALSGCWADPNPEPHIDTPQISEWSLIESAVPDSGETRSLAERLTFMARPTEYNDATCEMLNRAAELLNPKVERKYKP